MKRTKKSKAKSPLIRLVGFEAAVAATGIAGCLTAAAVLNGTPSTIRHLRPTARSWVWEPRGSRTEE